MNREKEVVFTELAARGGEQSSQTRKAHRKASAGSLSSVSRAAGFSKFQFFLSGTTKKLGERVRLIQSQFMVVAGLSNETR